MQPCCPPILHLPHLRCDVLYCAVALSRTVLLPPQVRVLGEGYTPDDEEDSAVSEVSAVSVYQVHLRISFSAPDWLSFSVSF